MGCAAHDAPAETRQHIQTQLQRADRLVSDMLVYSGKLTLQRSKVPLATLVRTVLAQVQLEDIQYQLSIDDDIELEADSQRLQQVFINLIDNAVAFLRNQPDAKLFIQARVEEDLQAKQNKVVIQIHNNGPSIDDALEDDVLFQPFVTKRAGGSGLGLAIVRRIVDAHGGEIHHRKRTDWPVTFELILPQQAPLGTDTHDTK